MVADIRLSPSDDGSSLEAQVGDRVSVLLPENPTTGFRWLIHELEGDALAHEADEFSRAPDARVGGGGLRTLLFRAEAPGRAIIRLARRRPWESPERVAERFEATVVVRDRSS